MKKQVMLLVITVSLGIGAAAAQGKPRMTIEERTKASMEKIAVLKLDTATTSKTQTIIADFYNAQQKAMEEMRATGSMDREAMMAKRKELAESRDVKLKAILNAEQFKSWVDEIEPSLRPQRMQKSN